MTPIMEQLKHTFPARLLSLNTLVFLAFFSPIILSSVPAHTLSCVKPDPLRSLASAVEAGDEVTVLQGTARQIGERIDTGPADPERPVDMNNGMEQDATYAFSGVQLSADHTPVQIREPLTVSLTCLLGWCGNVPSQADGLFLATGDVESGYKVVQGPCGGGFFPAPQDPEDIVDLRRCLTERMCARQ